MKKELIEELFVRFEEIKQERAGIEYWSAREIQELLGYSKWENFEKLIRRAQEATKNSGYDINGSLCLFFLDTLLYVPTKPAFNGKEVFFCSC